MPETPSRRIHWGWVVAALVLLRLVSIAVLLHTDLAGSDSILGGDAKRYEAIASGVGTPYRDFDVEYPPITLVMLKVVVGPTLGTTHVRLALSQLLAELGTAGILAWAFSRRTAIIYLLLGTPTVLFPFPYMRNDMLAVFLATLGLGLVRKGWDRSGGAGLAVAVFAKLWPLAVAPVLVVERKARGLAAWAFTLFAALVVWIAWTGTSGITQTTTFRGAKGWQIESLPGAVIHLLDPGGSQMEQGAWRTGVAVLAWMRPLLMGTSILVAVLAWWLADRRRGAGGGEHLSYGIAPLASILGLLVFSTIVSPQYILWIVPFAAIAAAAGERLIGWLTLSAIALTTYEFATIHAQIEGRLHAMVPLIARNILLVVLLVVVLTRLREPRAVATASPSV